MVNEKGQLLDHEGKVLDLVIPMSSDERRRLIKEIREEIRPVINHTCELQIKTGIEPI